MKNSNKKYLVVALFGITTLTTKSAWGVDQIQLAKSQLSQAVNIESKTIDSNISDGPKLDQSTKQSIAFQSNLNTAVQDAKLKNTSKTRGPMEAAIYDQVSAGTVLIVAGDGLGSGALITENGFIITNQHVVGKAKEVTVFFKPIGNSSKLNKNDAVLGTVVKMNESKDLALVKVNSVPSSARPIVIADGSPRVGEDAHAIGHPKGEFWTYTRGYVSGVRDNYQWSEGKNKIKREAKERRKARREVGINREQEEKKARG
jgi:S1-C subfamily serine protease